ncbi:sensor histidine kinase [Kribbella kalugense]|uniref:histidine kinase n=1 Tax=Kribbella kalugense TaxID=2512221 RepID=A0A4R8A207_9ACTN|nr:histidine kinase [Kribbella kalugense]TDW23388.1 histidine kinase [Kribbella kalugense]
MNRRVVGVVVAVAGAVVCVLLWRAGQASWQWGLLPWLYLVAGLIAWDRQPRNRTGVLLMLTGVAYLMFLFEGPHVPPLLWTIGVAFELAYLPALVAVLLSFPGGRLTRRWEQCAVLAAVVAMLCWTTIPILGTDPSDLGCSDCPPGLNLVHASPDVVSRLDRIYAAFPGRVYLMVPMLVGLAVVCVVRWWRASRPLRRISGPVLVAAVPLLLALSAQMIANSLKLYDTHPDVSHAINLVAMYAGLVHPVAILIGLSLGWARQARIGELVTELAEHSGLDLVERTMARVLGDPCLAIGRWDPSARRYLISTGADLPDAGSAQSTTYLEHDGRPMVAVVHDRALLDGGELLSSAGAAVRMAIDNDRLRAELSTQLAEVRASRSRIVVAADNERRRLERDLHDGAQQRLVSLALDARMAAAKLEAGDDPAAADSVAAIADGLTTALAELRELARGIHPSILVDEGLVSALRSLSERSAVPVRLLAVPPGRIEPAIEAVAYFVISEALANAAKHASAEEVSVAVRRVDGRVLVEIRDDGKGGADPEGSGLRGLADRVAAVDGRLRVDSPPGRGTVVFAEIPCVS